MGDINKKGVYGSTLVKKRRYWPHYIDGEKNKAHFTNKGVGGMDALPGKLDNVPLCLLDMKEEYYAAMLMSTYG